MRALLFVCCLFVWCIGARAETESGPLFFEDPSRTLGIEEIIARSDALPWKPIGRANFGYTASRIWVRFRLSDAHELRAGSHEPLLLEVPYVYNERLSLYAVSGGKVIRHSITGMGVPLRDRDPLVIRAASPVFRIPAPRFESTVYYFSLEGTFPLSLPLRFLAAPDLAEHQLFTFFFSGLFFGCLILATVFNAFLALSLRSRLYQSYALFAASTTMLFLAGDGYSIQLLWSNSPWWALRELHVFGGLTIFFYALFVREFLESRRVCPWLDRILLALVAASSIRSVWMLFELNRVVALVGEVAVVFANALVLVIAARALLAGVRSARYFFASSLLFNLAVVFFICQTAGVFWLGEFLEKAPHVGVLVEVLLLSFALADRIRRVNWELEQQKAAIVQAEKLSALGRMAGEIAHEISNPLAIIHGHAVLIKKEEGALPHIREFGATIEHTANRISKVVKGMRALARDSRRDPFRPAALGSIVQDALVFCQDKKGAKPVRLEVMDPLEGLSLRCRSSEISQVLANLLNNSFDAVDGVGDPWVKLEVLPRENMVEIAVIDNGHGVPKNLRSRIHEPFFTTKEAGKGLGLGLSISRTIIEGHGGQLWLDESSPNTRFAFTVPLGEA